MRNEERLARRVEFALKQAVHEARVEHKLLGLPIVVADEHGNPVWVPAEEIDITPFDAVEPQPPSEHDR